MTFYKEDLMLRCLNLKTTSFKEDFILRCLNLKMSLFKDDCLELFPTSNKQFCKSAKNFENQKRYFSNTL
jgi:hypothetical protein